MWFRKTPERLVQLNTFKTWDGCLFGVGQKVQHKVTGKKAVIVRIQRAPASDWALPIVSIGWRASEEFETTFSELEPFNEPASTNAVDPVDGIVTT